MVGTTATSNFTTATSNKGLFHGANGTCFRSETLEENLVPGLKIAAKNYPKIENDDKNDRIDDLIRFVVNALGLLVLRAILGSLPILKNASPFGESFMTPLVLAYTLTEYTRCRQPA